MTPAARKLSSTVWQLHKHSKWLYCMHLVSKYVHMMGQNIILVAHLIPGGSFLPCDCCKTVKTKMHARHRHITSIIAASAQAYTQSLSCCTLWRMLHFCSATWCTGQPAANAQANSAMDSRSQTALNDIIFLGIMHTWTTRTVVHPINAHAAFMTLQACPRAQVSSSAS